MITIAICDDEPLMVEELSRQLSDYMEEKQCTSYQISHFFSGQALLESGRDFDLLFLDIQMKSPDGMETAKRLRSRRSHNLLIFVTVLKECVFDAFEVEAWDYLVKPIDSGRLQRTMDRALKALQQWTDKSIALQRGNTCEVIALSRIVYCEAQGRKIHIHQMDGSVIVYYDKIKEVEQRLDGRFFKCHRSYLVNLDHIRGCGDGRVRLSQGGEIPVSRLRQQELAQALLHRMREREG